MKELGVPLPREKEADVVEVPPAPLAAKGLETTKSATPKETAEKATSDEASPKETAPLSPETVTVELTQVLRPPPHPPRPLS